MSLHDPIAAYNAESNMDAILAQRFLESEGVEAFVTEDNSLVGYWAFGRLPEIHKPQVWVSREDAERVGRLLAEYERRKRDRDAQHPVEPTTMIEVTCEECKQLAKFAGSLLGTVQNCPYCGSYLDVGEPAWPFDEEFGEVDSDPDFGR